MNKTTAEPQPVSREALIEKILHYTQDKQCRKQRLIIAIAGAPAAGKSTLAIALCQEINHALAPASPAVVVPMDGFHYDNAVLDAHGYRSQKGAPHTFDVQGLLSLLARVREDNDNVAIPVFDRAMDLSRAGAAIVTAQHRIVVVEGNYLLLDQPEWRDLAPSFDMTLFLNVPFAVLEQRLIQRWLDHGADAEAARNRALSNDIPNAKIVTEQSMPANFVLMP